MPVAITILLMTNNQAGQHHWLSPPAAFDAVL
jgi:hypothetical protein